MKLTPMGDRIIIKQSDGLEKTVGGIFIPDAAKEKLEEALVVSVGPGSSDYKMTLKTGDEVVYSKYAGIEIDHEGEKFIIISETEILAVKTKGK